MAGGLDKKIKKVAANLQKLKNELPAKLQNDALRYFVRNFDSEQWDGVRWQARKNKRNRRKLLVKSGALRRALAGSKREARFDLIRFSVYTQANNGYNYAEIHNEGGTIVAKKRDAILSFRRKRNNQVVFSKTRKAKFQQKITIGGYIIRIPKRKFIGNSKILNGILINKIKTEFEKAFN